MKAKTHHVSCYGLGGGSEDETAQAPLFSFSNAVIGLRHFCRHASGASDGFF